MTTYPTGVPTAAQWWYERGATVAPAATYRKGPRVKDWQTLPREALRGLFERGDNLALRTGDGGIADVDYDDDFAARAGAYFLPHTGVVFGRVGNPNSHRIYCCEDIPARGYVNYTDPLNGSKLLELRANAKHATIVPPSANSDNHEAIQMASGASLELRIVTYAALQRACAKTAAALVLRRYWPAQGSRQDTALALAGWLIASGWEEEDAYTFVEAVVADGTDDEPEKRMAGVHDTARRYAAGESITGRPTLAKLLAGDGEKLTTVLARWLELKQPHEQAKVPTDAKMPKESHRETKGTLVRGGHLSTVNLSTVEPESVRWLWQGYIPLGKVTVLDGDPGLGKSLLTLDLAARVTTGRDMPDGTPGVCGAVVVLSAEDDLADTIRPRLDAAGAIVAQVTALEAVGDVDTETGEVHERPVYLPQDIPAVCLPSHPRARRTAGRRRPADGLP